LTKVVLNVGLVAHAREMVLINLPSPAGPDFPAAQHPRHRNARPQQQAKREHPTAAIAFHPFRRFAIARFRAERTVQR
jgi:hypothetical protein